MRGKDMGAKDEPERTEVAAMEDVARAGAAQDHPLPIDEEGGIVVMQGIYENGFGLISNAVMRDPRLSCVSKAIYSYITSFTGAGKNSSFPSVKTILEELKLSRVTYYKHRAPLLELGYIRVVRKPKVGNRYGGNIYVIQPIVPGTGRSVLDSEIVETDKVFNNPQVDEGYKNYTIQDSLAPNYSENDEGYKNFALQAPANPQVSEGFSFETLQNQHTNKLDRYIDINTGEDEDGHEDVDIDEACDRLISISVGFPDDRDKVRAAYEKAVADGFSPDAIDAAYADYVKSYRSTHDSPRYIMHLDKFLSVGTGLRYYAVKPSESANSPFRPPTVEEVAEYVSSKGYDVDAEQFVAYYDARDWTFGGGQKMKRWKSAVVTWHKRSKSGELKKKPTKAVSRKRREKSTGATVPGKADARGGYFDKFLFSNG